MSPLRNLSPVRNFSMHSSNISLYIRILILIINASLLSALNFKESRFVLENVTGLVNELRAPLVQYIEPLSLCNLLVVSSNDSKHVE